MSRRVPMPETAMTAYVEAVAALAPPLTAAQRDRLSGLLRPSPLDEPVELRQSKVSYHYDVDGAMLYAGHETNDLLQMVRRRFVVRTETQWHVNPGDEISRRMKAAVFGNAKSKRALEYLIKHEAWDMLTPVVELNSDAGVVHPGDWRPGRGRA